MAEHTSWFSDLPEEVRVICERIEPLAEKAEAGPLSFADVNRLHGLVLDFARAVKPEPCPDCGCPGERYDGHVCEDFARSAD